MPETTLHQAGEPNRIHGMQYCDLCGAVLIDNSGAMVPDGSAGPRFFAPGTLVTAGPGFVTVAKDPDAVPCVGQPDEGGEDHGE